MSRTLGYPLLCKDYCDYVEEIEILLYIPRRVHDWVEVDRGDGNLAETNPHHGSAVVAFMIELGIREMETSENLLQPKVRQLKYFAASRVAWKKWSLLGDRGRNNTARRLD
jgi:hypothetical protein